MRLLYLFILGVLSASFLYAQDPGELDPTFGNNGISAINIGGSGSHAYSIVIAPDDKIIAAGGAMQSGQWSFAVAKYMADGSLDSGFGNNGFSITPVGAMYDIPWAADLRQDGKIVLVGESWTGAVTSDFGIACYNPDGTLDVAFSQDGILTLRPGTSFNQCNAVKALPDGKILIAGNAKPSVTMDFCIARLNPDGTLDNTFGTNGMVFTNIGDGDDYPYGIAIQPGDDKIVVSGMSAQGATGYFTTVRYNPDGSLDNSFNGTGIVTTNISSGYAYAIGVRIQSDGKIVVAGNVPGAAYPDFGIVRYLSDGTLDPSFGTGGITITSMGAESTPFSIAVQPDEKCLVGGWIKNGAQYDFALVRYTTDGVLDAGFGNDGMVFTNISNENDNINSIAFQSDGKIVVGGGGKVSGGNDFVLARYYSGLPLGISTLHYYDNIQISPNPVVHGSMTLTGSGLENVRSVEIMDCLGKPVYQLRTTALIEERNPALKLQLPSDFHPGSYFLKVDTKNGIRFLPFLKSGF